MIGPVFRRELLTASRRGRTYSERVEYAALIVLLAGGIGAAWWFASPTGLSYRTLGRAAWQVFGLVVFGQMVVALGQLPQVIARGLAGERDNGTLASLLATALPSRTIVLDVVLSAWVRYMSWLAVGLPAMLVLTMYGGVDPRLVLLSYGGLAALGVFIGGLSAAVAVASPGRKSAAQLGSMLVAAWAVWPTMMMLLVPRFAPRLYAAIRPVNDWLVASSPMTAGLDLVRGAPWSRVRADLAWMAGLQVAGGAALLALAIGRLRPASRRLEERGAAKQRRRMRRVPDFLQRRRPPCGDDPMLWKELYTGQPMNWATLLAVGMIVAVFLTGGYALLRYLAIPAFLEWRAAGFAAGGTGTARRLFQDAIRLFTGVIGFVMMLVVAGVSAEGIVLERSRDTWTSLLVTDLEGREILRAKRFGPMVRVLPLIAFPGLLWAAGLGTGALHPLGVAGAAAVLTGMLAAAGAWGVACSLRGKDAQQANNRALAPVLVVAMSGLLPLVLPARFATVLLGAASPPFVASLALISPAGLRSAWSTQEWARVASGDGPGRYLAALLIDLALWWAFAWAVRRASEQWFDKAVGRPRRVEGRSGPARDGGVGRAEPALVAVGPGPTARHDT